MSEPLLFRGRGAQHNPANRFVPVEMERDGDLLDQEDPISPQTVVYQDQSRSIINENDSPDIPFRFSLNPYRGCEHGCVYCYARPTHEYFGLSLGLDFETKLFAKMEAPTLLRESLLKPSWKGESITISGVTDCYQPIERKLQLTRQCLQVLAEFRNPVALITKNALIERDTDILADLAKDDAAVAYVTVTTLDPELAGRLEPRASSPKRRLQAVETLVKAGVPVGVMVAPLIPALTDHEVPAILKAAQEAGASFTGYVMLRLPYGLSDLFAQWLEDHYPLKKDKILRRIQDIRGGKLNDPRFGSRMQGEGVFAEQVEQLFRIAKKKAGLGNKDHRLSSAAFRRPETRDGQFLLDLT